MLLAAPLGVGHGAQALRRGCRADRKADDHGRDVVPELPVAVVVRPDRDEHLEHAALHDLAPEREEVVHAAGDRRQQEIVQRDPEVALGPAQVVHRLLDHLGAAVETDRDVQGAVHRCGRARQQAGERRAVVGHHLARPRRVAHRAPPVGRELHGERAEARQPLRAEREPAGGSGGLPWRRHVTGGRPGLQVEEHGGQFDACQPVGNRVVEHLEQTDAAALEPVDQPEVPERVAAVERERHEVRAELQQLGVVARFGQCRLVHVVGDVELVVVHPHRGGLADQREPYPLAQLRHEVQAARHLGPHVVETQAATGVVQGRRPRRPR